MRGERLEVGITSFRDLAIYQKSYVLALEVHKLTRELPEVERYELGHQLRKAAVSIPANIAEGYGRKNSQAEFKHFLRNALGSSNEIQVLPSMIQDLDYRNTEKLITEYDVLGKQIYRLIETWK